MSKSMSCVTITSKPEKVWAALTRADPVKQWQYGSDLVTTSK